MRPDPTRRPPRTAALTLMALTLVALSPLTLAACGSEDSGGGAPSTAPEPEAETRAEPSESGAAAVAPVLAAYEQVRAHLAADRGAEATAAAGTLRTAATAAASAAPEAMRAHLGAIASAATALGAASADDLGGLRNAFGSVSRPLVALLVDNPELREGRHLFRCPMAQGYPRWIQPSEEISNPYMGTEMLRCGAAAEWTPDEG